ncbi:MAG: TonB-dependent receptor plug domain-containing protein, partial [Spongiibacteraceae bacterium]
MASVFRVSPLVIAMTAAMAGGGVVSSTALAQSEGGFRGGLEEVVVTARKREETLQSVPIAVTAVTAESIQNQSIQDLRQIQYSTPGLTMNPPNSDRSNSAPQIRGQSISDTVLTVDPAVGIYIDGVNIAKTNGGELSSLLDVERIEVLKGPQGTLFGRNTTGGAISVSFKQPTGEFEGEVIGRTDNWGRKGGALVLNLPITGPDLALRIAGQYDNREGFGENVANGDDISGDMDSGNVRTALLWRPTETVELTLRADYTHSNQEGPAYKLGGLVPSSLGVQNIGMQRGLTAAQAATATERANSVALAMGEINSLDFQDVLQNFGSK